MNTFTLVIRLLPLRSTSEWVATCFSQHPQRGYCCPSAHACAPASIAVCKVYLRRPRTGLPPTWRNFGALAHPEITCRLIAWSKTSVTDTDHGGPYLSQRDYSGEGGCNSKRVKGKRFLGLGNYRSICVDLDISELARKEPTAREPGLVIEKQWNEWNLFAMLDAKRNSMWEAWARTSERFHEMSYLFVDVDVRAVDIGTYVRHQREFLGQSFNLQFLDCSSASHGNKDRLRVIKFRNEQLAAAVHLHVQGTCWIHYVAICWSPAVYRSCSC